MVQPTGPSGKQGPPGAGFELTSESLVYAGSPLAISTLVNTTYITNTSYDDAVLTLANGAAGDIKYIYLQNSVLPVQVRTELGSFNLTPLNNQIQLAFTTYWIQISDKTPWYTDIQQGLKLVGTGAMGPTPQQGNAVALSADGRTLAVGGNGDDGDIGATWMFTRVGTNWIQQAMIVGSGGVGIQGQGFSIDISADGNTLAVGGPLDDVNKGPLGYLYNSL